MKCFVTETRHEDSLHNYENESYEKSIRDCGRESENIVDPENIYPVFELFKRFVQNLDKF